MKTGHYNHEKNTTIKLILPLFAILGWDPLSKDMEFEFPVYRKKTKKISHDHVDIALYTNKSKKPRIIVEIKPIQKDLTRGTQLLRYLRNAKISHGIYTNGREIKLIGMPGVRHGFAPSVLFHLKNLDDFLEYKDVLWLLSKDSFKKGRLDKLVKFYHNGREYPKWRRDYRKKYPDVSRDRLRLIYARMKIKEL